MSLLDAKNEILLSYLHNLVFLIILQLRGAPSSKSKLRDQDDANGSLCEDVVKKLVELRVYMDRGVKPMEGRLKYQVDKVVKAAEDAERIERDTQVASRDKAQKKMKTAGSDHSDKSASEEDDSGSEDGSEDEGDEEDIDELAYRPNVSSFSKGIEPPAQSDKEKARAKATSDGIYRPPKIMPTAPPTEERRERAERRPAKSNVIDEFVTAEMSSAPIAEPSIGSTIREGGRHMKSKKERESEAEKAAYEEANFTRLQESKKDMAKSKRGAAARTFGGEEWQMLGEGADRISQLTRQAKGSNSALERSRKRKPAEDGSRSDAAGVGSTFEKRRKKIEGWKR